MPTIKKISDKIKVGGTHRITHPIKSLDRPISIKPSLKTSRKLLKKHI